MTIPFNVVTKDITNTSPNTTINSYVYDNGLSRDENKVLEYLHEKTTIVRNDLEELLGTKQTKAKEILKLLIDKDKIITLGSNKNIYYKLK